MHWLADQAHESPDNELSGGVHPCHLVPQQLMPYIPGVHKCICSQRLLAPVSGVKLVLYMAEGMCDMLCRKGPCKDIQRGLAPLQVVTPLLIPDGAITDVPHHFWLEKYGT